MTDPGFFNQFLIWPSINVLMVFYKVFTIAQIPGPLGWSIIAMTIVIRGVLYPLTAKQMDSAKKMQDLKPELDKIKSKYKDDKKMIQQEQMKLYQKHGINPAAGCLPLLLQFPILIALYRMFLGILNAGSIDETVQQINQVVYAPWLKIESLDLGFFGLNLADRPSQWQELGWWLLAVPVITGVLQWYQTKQMMPSPTKDSKQLVKKTNKNGKKDESFGTEMQKQMAFIMPIMIGFFAYNFPLGLSLYWNTFTVFAFFTHRHRQKKSTNK